tara:strand:+ start:43 stop:579 length:537 start_codon:yes stop_codon:yes gene_type:complete
MIKKGLALIATKEGRNLVKGFYEKGKGIIKKRKKTKEAKAANRKRELEAKKSLKKYGIQGGRSGSRDASAIVPVKLQTGAGSSFKTRVLGPKGQTPYQGKRLGSAGNMESWRNDMERTFKLPSFEEVSRSIFKKRGPTKKSKGGDIKIVSNVAKKLTKASAAHAGQAKALKRIVSKYV